MAATLNLGTDGNWATKEGSLLAYNSENNNYKPLPFDFTRASSATVVNKDGLIETVGSGIPRIDYLDNTSGSLLLEPQSTNLITYSEDFSNAAWNFKSNVNLQSGMLSPKGDLNAYKITATTTDSSYIGGFLNQSIGKYKSIWARTVSGTGKVNLLNVRTEGSTNGLFNLSEEWTRFEILQDGVDIFYGVDFRNSLSTLNEIIIYGAQLEAGSYPTSYIPTQGGVVTRLADSCSQTPPDGVIGQAEGTMFFDGYYGDEVSEIYLFTQSSTGAGVADSMYLQKSGASSVKFIGRDALSSTQWDITGGSFSIGQKIKIAAAYKNNDVVLYINGVQIGADSVASIPTMSNIKIGGYPSQPNISNYFLSKPIDSIQLYNTRLSNSELQALTQV